MNAFLTRLFSPILNFFEGDAAPQNYKPLHRKILMVVGLLFLLLSGVSVYLGLSSGQAGALIPIAVFFTGSVVCLVVATLGSDGAVAKIWGVK